MRHGPILEGKGRDLISWYLNPPPRIPFAEWTLTPFFNLVIVWNQGISFGMLNQNFNYGPALLVAVSLAIVLVFLYILLRKPNTKWQSLAIAMIIGGALGNVIDRLRFGAVIDFLDFHIGSHHWPSFNVGDSCICIGVFILIIQGLFFEKPLPAQA